MVACGFAGSVLLAAYLAVLDRMSPDDALFDRLAGTWRIVARRASSPSRSRRRSTTRSAPGCATACTTPCASSATNAVSVPLDSVVFLLVAFGSLEFIEGQIVVKYAVT